METTFQVYATVTLKGPRKVVEDVSVEDLNDWIGVIKRAITQPFKDGIVDMVLGQHIHTSIEIEEVKV